MTHPSPLPPPAHPGGPPNSATVSTVMFGQGYLDAAGQEQTAAADGVLLYLHGGNGEVIATRFQNSDGAIDLALAIQHCAVQAINNSVDNNGKRLRARDRIALLNDAYKKAGQ